MLGTYLQSQNTKNDGAASRDKPLPGSISDWRISNENPSQNFRDTGFRGRPPQQKLSEQYELIKEEGTIAQFSLKRQPPLEIPVLNLDRAARGSTEHSVDGGKVPVAPTSTRTEILKDYKMSENRQDVARLTCTRTSIRQLAPFPATKHHAFPADASALGCVGTTSSSPKLESKINARICGTRVRS